MPFKRKSDFDQRSTRIAKIYDNVDPQSLNNPFEDPDLADYAINTPDNFQEDPDLRSEWRNDREAYDDEHNFMMPLNDVPSWYGTVPKMAYKKAEACLKIATQLFPDGTNEFVDAQAMSLMQLPDQAVVATLRRMAMYEEEGRKFADENNDGDGFVEVNLGEDKSLPAELQEGSLEDLDQAVDQGVAELEAPVMDTVEEVAPMETMTEMDQVVDMGSEDMDSTDDMDEVEMDEMDDAFDMDAELAEALGDSEDVDLSSEMDIDFNANPEDEDLADEDSDLAGLFDEDTERVANASRLSKTASRKNNLKLSQLAGSAVPKNRQSYSLSNVWESAPNIEDSFKD